MSTAPTTSVSCAAALREAADLIDAHPDLPAPYVTTSFDGTATLHWFLNSDHRGDPELQAVMDRVIRVTLAGNWTREEHSSNAERTYTTQTRGRVRLVIVTGEPIIEQVPA